MGAKHAAKRDAVNQAAVAALEGRENSGVGNVVKDMLSLLSLRNSLSGISSEMSARFTGANTANERNAQRAMLSNSLRNLAMEAVKLLPEKVHESTMDVLESFRTIAPPMPEPELVIVVFDIVRLAFLEQ